MYPTAKIVSLDMTPLTALVPHPSIRFEVYDLCSGIAEPDASFDLAHARQCIVLIRLRNSKSLIVLTGLRVEYIKPRITTFGSARCIVCSSLVEC